MDMEVHLVDQSRNGQIALECWVGTVALTLYPQRHVTTYGQVTVISQRRAK